MPLSATGFAVAVGIALPAFHADPVGDLLDRRWFGIVRVVDASIPHVPFAEAKDDAIARLIDADRQIAVAEQQAILGNQDGLGDGQGMARQAGHCAEQDHEATEEGQTRYVSPWSS